MTPSAFIDRVEADDLEGVRSALEAGQDVNADDRGWTALICAAQAGLRRMTDGLIGAGADVNASNHEGFTALHMVVQSASRNPERGHYGELRKIAARLVLSGADVNAATHATGQTPLRNACRVGLSDIVDVLLSSPDADLERVDGAGSSLLHVAALSGSVETVRLVLAAGAAPDVRDRVGATALHYAAEAGSAPMVTLLLEAGADASSETTAALEDVPAGSTPRSVAALRGRADVLERLT